MVNITDAAARGMAVVSAGDPPPPQRLQDRPSSGHSQWLSEDILDLSSAQARAEANDSNAKAVEMMDEKMKAIRSDLLNRSREAMAAHADLGHEALRRLFVS